MAKLEYAQEEKKDLPESVERIEVRTWGIGGRPDQEFLIGSGGNFQGNANILLEIIYSVNGVQFFYTRNYLHYLGEAESDGLEEQLEKFRRSEVDVFSFGDMLPETFIRLKRERFSYSDLNGQETRGEVCQLEISADVGAVIGRASPGMRRIDIKLEYLDPEIGVRFMRDLTQEIADAQQGRRPNPADLPEGASDWPFIRQLNQKAYDLISEDYQEEYFSNPVLALMFDSWLAQLPAGGHILDAGCGHGAPVIGRLLEEGFRVTGTDLSPRMLKRARTNFPAATFTNQMVSDLSSEMEFDGACSFSSLLYLDPIDLAHSIYRLYCAIKPGGLLFLCGDDLHPNWRGLPYDVQIRQWMWSWSYGMEEAARALEEFGYFKVLEMQDVTTEAEREARIARWRQYRKEEHDKLVASMPPEFTPPILDLSRVPDKLAYTYAVIARRKF